MSPVEWQLLSERLWWVHKEMKSEYEKQRTKKKQKKEMSLPSETTSCSMCCVVLILIFSLVSFRVRIYLFVTRSRIICAIYLQTVGLYCIVSLLYFGHNWTLYVCCKKKDAFLSVNLSQRSPVVEAISSRLKSKCRCIYSDRRLTRVIQPLLLRIPDSKAQCLDYSQQNLTGSFRHNKSVYHLLFISAYCFSCRVMSCHVSRW